MEPQRLKALRRDVHLQAEALKMPGKLKSGAGRFRACRRLFLLIYATAVLYFFYAPWNYLFLGAL
jgi:hypothetical protein